MEATNENKCDVIFTFLKDTKDGKYAIINPNIIETPRVMTSRNEYLFDEDMPVLFSVSNQL